MRNTNTIVWYSNPPHGNSLDYPRSPSHRSHQREGHQCQIATPKVGSLVSWSSFQPVSIRACQLSVVKIDQIWLKWWPSQKIISLGGTGGVLELISVKLLLSLWHEWLKVRHDRNSHNPSQTQFEATYRTTPFFRKFRFLSRWYDLNWFEFQALVHMQKVWKILVGSLLLRMQLPSRVSGNFSRILVQDLAAPISLPNVIPRVWRPPFSGVWTMSLRSQRQKRSVMSFPGKCHGVLQMQKPFNKQ